MTKVYLIENGVEKHIHTVEDDLHGIDDTIEAKAFAKGYIKAMKNCLDVFIILDRSENVLGPDFHYNVFVDGRTGDNLKVKTQWVDSTPLDRLHEMDESLGLV